ncbi:lipopolysaccharide-induced tumor necrosis factor-alpha factor isoform X2 [Anolis carolinensis]
MTAPPPPSAPLPPPPSYEETLGSNNSAQNPPKGGQPPPYPHPGPAIYVQNQVAFYDQPVHMVCPSCGHLIVTHIDRKSGTLSWISCGTLCLLGCWAGCCLLPFCIDAFLDVDHNCPNCHALLGSYRRL